MSTILRITVYQRIIKPIGDFFVALAILSILMPIILIVWLLLSTQTNNGVFFKQMRSGKDGKPFELIKFKTMNNDTDSSGNLMPDRDRLTSVGKLIRKTSLDELPQLINVLKGELSIVGPRPLLMQYLSRYNAFQKRRHEVKPGITGWAQVNGRNNVSWQKRFKDDVWYVDHQSFLLDIKILVKTIFVVLAAKDINKEGHATMEEFKGN